MKATKQTEKIEPSKRMYQEEMPKWARMVLKTAKREGWTIGTLHANCKDGGAVFYDPEQLLNCSEGVARSLARALFIACNCDMELTATVLADECAPAFSECARFLLAAERDRANERAKQRATEDERRKVDELNRQHANKPRYENGDLIEQLSARYETYVEPSAVARLLHEDPDTVRELYEFYRTEPVITERDVRFFLYKEEWC